MFLIKERYTFERLFEGASVQSGTYNCRICIYGSYNRISPSYGQVFQEKRNAAVTGSSVELLRSDLIFHVTASNTIASMESSYLVIFTMSF